MAEALGLSKEETATIEAECAAEPVGPQFHLAGSELDACVQEEVVLVGTEL